jgi:pumilio family protein 6
MSTKYAGKVVKPEKRKAENGSSSVTASLKKVKISNGHGVNGKPTATKDEDSDFEVFAAEEDETKRESDPALSKLLEIFGTELQALINTDNKSRESHLKQKELQAQRKAAKPHADDISRAKKLWEQLRRKSHVEKEERDKLVTELFGIISGRVKDFVFKHDSVRVVQCAVKYANRTQKQQIATELKGSFKELAESKYGKFLLAKLIIEGDGETRAIIIPEFYGSIKRLINHPEASWILDDVYRTVATKQQRARMLRELYGPEFAVFGGEGKISADVGEIIKDSPEKKQVILNYLHERINQLVQKKMTGFTILHDAMLQYFLNTPVESEKFGDFQKLIIGDKDEEEKDLLRNLAFTESGSELICRVFAHSPAKDRRQVLKMYHEVFEMLAYDKWGHRVLLTILALMDDTREISQRVFSELVLLVAKKGSTASAPATPEQVEKITSLALHAAGHVSLLYLFLGTDRKILNPALFTFLEEMQALAKTAGTSKKDPAVRRGELGAAISQLCLDTAAANTKLFLDSSFGCLFVSQVLLHGQGEKQEALQAIANLAGTSDGMTTFYTPHAGKLVKMLITAGQFDKAQGRVIVVEDLKPFKAQFLDAIKPNLKDWVLGDGGFVVLNLLHADWDSNSNGGELKALSKAVEANKKALQKQAAGKDSTDGDSKRRVLAAEKLLGELST